MTGSNWHEEDGFKFQLFPAKNGKPESLIIYMHGVNNTPNLPLNYIRDLQKKIPGADFIALQGPILVEQSRLYKIAEGYSWFPLGDKYIPSQVGNWLTHAFNRLPVADQIEAFAYSQLTKRGLTGENLAYCGHSQGGIVALQTGLCAEKPVAAVVSYGGAVMPLTKVKNQSKVFLQMGEHDEIFNIPLPPAPPQLKGLLKDIFTRTVDQMNLNHARSAERLKNQKVQLTEKIYPHHGHLPSALTWSDGVDFMAKALKRPKP